MIGKLTGRVDSIAADYAIVDVGGVGYVVHCAAPTLSRLQAGATVSLAIETKISDEAIRLYGFFAPEERDWFRLLQTVQGVGARVALAILSTLKVPELQRAILMGDKATVGRAPGVGPKLATRIVTELKDKAPAVLLARANAAGTRAPGPQAPPAAEFDAVAALVSLGYTATIASEAVARAAQGLGETAALDALIREALRHLARTG